MNFGKTLKRFMSINKDYYPYFYITLFILIADQAIIALMNYSMGNLTDAITGSDTKLFISNVITLALIQILHLLTGYLVNYRVNYLSESFVKRLRSHTYERITKASMKWLDENRLGDIISRINGDLNALVEQINNFLTWNLAGIVTFVVCIFACFFINIKLSLISFALVPFLAYFQFASGKPIAKLSEKRSVAEGKSNSIFVDLIGGLGIIRIFKAEKSMKEKYDRQVADTLKANIKSFALEFLMNPLQMIMAYVPTIIILVAGSRMVIKGELSLGMLFSFILLSSSALESVGNLSWQVRSMYTAAGTANRIFDIWDAPEETDNGENTQKQNENPLVIKDLTFGYNEENTVLHGVSLTAEKNMTTAIVGSSGSGKSTVMKLLSGFYEKNSGEILIFGCPMEKWNKKALRSLMSYVGQDSFLFPGSIYDNVAMGNENATEEEILEVIRAVGLDKLDIHCPVGERGTLLSGGQKQRVCVARALLKDADILLMDEPTSALDTESEFFVKEAVEKYTKNKTCITIAHRLSTIRNAEKIICMDNGTIAETGTHEELMEKGGIYSELYTKQQITEGN